MTELEKLAVDIDRALSRHRMDVFPIGIDRWMDCYPRVRNWCRANDRVVLAAPIDRQNFIWRGIPVVIAGA